MDAPGDPLDDEGWPAPREGRCNERTHPVSGEKKLCLRAAGYGTAYDTGPCRYHGGHPGTKPGEPVPPPAEDGWPPPADGRCNAKLSDPPRRCRAVAGRGTDYVVGPCSQHGGRHANGRRAAARATYEREFAGSPLFGDLVELPPMLGLTMVAAKLHGFAAYVEARITETADPETGHVQLVDTAGDKPQVAVPVRLWMDALERAARVYKMGADAGVQQQQIDLVASYQDRVLDIVEAIVRDLGHDPDDARVAELVGTRLALVAGGMGPAS
jgi:hypothetical protein